MKKKISYKQAQILDNLITNYVVKNDYFVLPISKEQAGGYTDKEPTKMVLNMKNIAKQLKSHFDTYFENIEELRLDHCAVDEKTKVVLRNADGTRQFTKEGEKSFNAAIKQLSNSTFEINVRITEGLWDLNEEEIEAFSGILINEVTEPKDNPETKELI